MPTIVVSEEARQRHTPDSTRSHYEGPGGWDDVIQLVRDNIGRMRLGTHGKDSDCRLVPIPPKGFRARRPNRVQGPKPQATGVNIVLWRRRWEEGDCGNTDPFIIVSINAYTDASAE